MYLCNTVFFTDYLKFGLVFFPIALSAVQSMDHSFDGISIKMEEGADQRKANTWNFRQIFQFLRKGIINVGLRCIVFLICGYCFPCSVMKCGRIKIPSWSETPWATHRKIHPSHFKYWDIMLSICVKTDDSEGCTECSCSSGYRRKQWITLKTNPTKAGSCY